MTDPASDPGRRVAALQLAHAAHRDPLRFALIINLQTRLSGLQGHAREAVQGRLLRHLDACEQALAPQPAAPAIMTVAAHPLQAVRRLLEAAPRMMPERSSTDANAEMLEELQQLWRRLRIDSQLQKLRDSVPEDAGPLHSSAVLCRAISVMRSVAPGYLQHFIAHADTLVWLECLLGESGTLASPPHGNGKPQQRRRRR